MRNQYYERANILVLYTKERARERDKPISTKPGQNTKPQIQISKLQINNPKNLTTMPTPKPTSTFINFTLTLFTLFTLFTQTLASEQPISKDEDLEGLEDLIALDQEIENQINELGNSKTEVLTKAQRIVIELDSDNIRRIIDKNEFVLVLGYTPWCARSAELMPKFAAAATFLSGLGSTLLLAKLDSERYPKLATSLGIKGFPTLLLFVNGSSVEYSGGFSEEDIVIWARKKTGFPVIRVSSEGEAEEFLKKYHTFVMGLFEKFEGTDYEEFVKASISDNELQFVETNNFDVAKVFIPDIKPNKPVLGLVKSEPERYTTFEDTFEKDKILQFLEYNKFPLVTKLTELNSVRVYSSPIKLQVFVIAEAGDIKNLLEPLQNIAKKFKSKLLFVYIDIAEDNLAKPFLTIYGLEESKKTIVSAFNTNMSSKHLLELDLTSTNIEEFCSGLLHGTLSPYYKSQPIPDSNGEGVQVVVGKTFDELVLSSPKNVFLEVSTPWCIRCETTSKQMEKLAKHFKGLDNLVFAKIDASANEHSKLQIDDYPTLLFYPANDKSNPIKVPTKSSLKDMASFINKHVNKASETHTNDEL